MSRWPVFCVIAVLGFSSTWALPIFAQPGVPPLSPWLKLESKQGGGLDNYNSYVRPEFQFNNALQTQQAAIQSNAAGISNMSSDRGLTAYQAMRAQPNPTGVAAGFMTQGAYFMTQGRGGSGGVANGVGMNGGRMNNVNVRRF